MANDLFNNLGINMPKLINDNIGPSVLDATLRKITGTTRDPANPTSGKQPTTEDHTCKGFIDDQSVRSADGTLVEGGIRDIILLGGSLPAGVVPTIRDRIIIEDAEYAIDKVSRDPAAATYTCACTTY